MSWINYVGDSAAREAIDARDRFEALRLAEDEMGRRFDGSMFYEARGGQEYLLRRRGGSQSKTSLGPRSAETDALLTEFAAGKDRLASRIDGLRSEIQGRARIIVAHGLGRVPVLTARILRRLHGAGWLGTRLIVVGTNALFAYEAKAGLRIAADATTTEDVDILYDARRRVSLRARAASERHGRGMVEILRKVDRSFGPTSQRSFRAINDQGFMVDLIEPTIGDPMPQERGRLSDNPDDIEAVAIEGLTWLINAPRFEAIAFDRRGLPVRIPTIDPRVFALHKLWMAQRPDRDALKRHRDARQAEVVGRIATEHLGLSLDAQELSAAPRTLVNTLAASLESAAAPEW